ncbi:MAG TPA: hypothetical protein V6C58_26785 [Allocoleopsis sp.]
MKRVVAFFDMFDEIPDNSKYLFSRKVEVPLEESEEQKTARIISNNPEAHNAAPAVIYVHYYEVDGMDFDELMETDFARKQAGEKMKDFMHKYKIPVK